MKKLLLFLFPLLAFACTAMAQDAAEPKNELKGRVVDNKDNPISGAKVVNVGNSSEQTTTDMNGQFSLRTQYPVGRVAVDYMGMVSAKKKAQPDMVIHMHNITWWNRKPDKMRFFVLAEGAVAETKHIKPAFGLMVGQVKQWGWYAKGVYNKNQSFDYEIDETGYDVWTTGKVKPSYWSAAVGVVRRLASPFHVYLGLGYFNREVAWEMPSGEYFKNETDSGTGLCVDGGLMFKTGHFAINGGATFLPDCESNFVVGFGIGYVF